MRIYAIVPAAVAFDSENTLFTLSTQCRQVAESVASSGRMQQGLQFVTTHPALVVGAVILCIVIAASMSLKA